MTRKRKLIGAIFISIVLAMSTGCLLNRPIKSPSGKSADELYKNGVSQLNKKNYRQAVETFYKLKYDFPAEAAAMMADLKIADAHYASKEYQEAIENYEDFRKMHPASPYIPYVVYMLGLCHYKRILTLDRDQTNSERALSEFQYLLTHFPNTPYVWDAQEKAKECMKRLSDHEVYVGDFYYRMKKYEAAIHRYETALTRFPSIPLEDETLYRLAEAYRHNQQDEKAQTTWQILIEQYPKSKYAKKANHRLESPPPHKQKPPAMVKSPQEKAETSKLSIIGGSGSSEKPAPATSESETQAGPNAKETRSEETQPSPLIHEKSSDSSDASSHATQAAVQAMGLNEASSNKETALASNAHGPQVEPAAERERPKEVRETSLAQKPSPVVPEETSASTLARSREINPDPTAFDNADISRSNMPVKETRDEPQFQETQLKATEVASLAGVGPLVSPQAGSPPLSQHKAPGEEGTSGAVAEPSERQQGAIPAEKSSAASKTTNKPSSPHEASLTNLGFGELRGDQPINITADRMDAFQKENRVVFEGNVVVNQEETYIYAQHITADLADQKRGGGIRHVVALNDVRITKNDQVATCEKAEFDHISRTIQLSGNPKIWRGNDRIDGEKVFVNLDQEKMTVVGSNERRVSAVIYPKSGKGPAMSPKGGKGSRPSLTAPFALSETASAPGGETVTRTAEAKPAREPPPGPPDHGRLLAAQSRDLAPPPSEGEKTLSAKAEPSLAPASVRAEDEAARIASAALNEDEVQIKPRPQDLREPSSGKMGNFVRDEESPTSESVDSFVKRWRKAWESKDLEAYMACYSKRFQSGQRDWSAWRTYKNELNERARFIQIELEELHVAPNHRGVKVSFVQRYRSDRHMDLGQKELDLVKEGGEWKILKETWRAL